jgi:4-amino-4-deoxy-L-arabinose transferase-like glycosyltransferase
MQNDTMSGADRVQSRTTSVLLLLLIVIFSLVYFFSNINADLIRAGEARAAEIAREMLERGNFVLPSLNHVVSGESLTKPPFYHWVLTLTSAPLDWPNWAVRLTSVLASLGAIWMTLLCGSRMFGFRAGVFAALVLSTCIVFLENSSAARMDIFFSFLILSSIYCFWMAINSEPGSKWVYGFYLLSGLGVLTKGPIGILFPALVAILLAWNNPGTRSWSELRLGRGILLFLAVVLPWYTLLYITAPGDLGFNFLFGQLAHWWAGSSNSAASGGKPFHYYLPHVLVGFFPWSLFLPAALVIGVRAARRENNTAIKSMLFWFLGGLILFSLGGKKAARYLLPIMAPFALIMGFYLDRIQEGVSRRHGIVIRLSTVLVLLLAVALALLLAGILGGNELVMEGLFKGQRKGGASTLDAVITMLQDNPVAAATTVGVMLLAAVLALATSIRRNMAVMILGLAAVIWALVWPYSLTIKPVLQEQMSPRSVAEKIAGMLPPDAVLYGGGKGYQHSMRWYLERNIRIEGRDRLYNRVLQEPDSWVLLMEKKPLRPQLLESDRSKLQWQIEYYYVTLYPGSGQKSADR